MAKRSLHLLSSLGLIGAAAALNIFYVSHTHAVSSEELLARGPSAGAVLYQDVFTQAEAQLKDAQALQRFYEARAKRPFWLDRFGPSRRAQDLVSALQGAWTHGLNPSSYHLEAIEALWGAQNVEARLKLDMLLSDAYVRFGQDLTGIRVNPARLKTSKAYWKQPQEAEQLLNGLRQVSNIERHIQTLAPRGQTYSRLRQELQRLVEQGAEAYEHILPIRFDGILRPYDSHRAVPDLRLRLGLPERAHDAYIYDDQMAGAVIQFQKDNGIKADGLIGQQTLGLLNISRTEKIHQVVANLERLRWVDEEKPDKFVIVNIPSATLWAVDEGRVEFEMPVIVGRKKRPTHMFITEIHGVRYNPNWTVPPTIKRKDIWPRLIEDPEYMTRKGMELISMTDEGPQSIDPTSVDWEDLSSQELHDFKMVQVPGASNPLGQVRVLMPNRYNIYLHDTNEKSTFERANRAASSGCVRLKDSRRMAEFIMRQKPGWDSGRSEVILASGKMRDLYVPEPIPVYLLYYTVWMNQDGELIYGNDLYGFDRDLIKMLEELDGIFIPVNNTEMSVAHLGS